MKIQRHYEEFPFIHQTIISKQVPLQQFKHPRCVLHIIRPDPLSMILDDPSASTDQAIFTPKIKINKKLPHFIIVSKIPIYPNHYPQCQSQFYISEPPYPLAAVKKVTYTVCSAQ